MSTVQTCRCRNQPVRQCRCLKSGMIHMNGPLSAPTCRNQPVPGPRNATKQGLWKCRAGGLP
eukprot:1191059-Amphidinium_carterae.1